MVDKYMIASYFSSSDALGNCGRSIFVKGCCRVFCSLLAVTVVTTAGCKSRSESNKGAPSATSASVAAHPTSLAARQQSLPSLLRLIPENSIGFLTWDTTSASYKKLSQSAWGGGQDMLSSIGKSSLSEKLLPVLKKAGLDPSDRTTMEALFSQATLFGTKRIPDSSKNRDTKMPPVNLGVAFRSKGVSLEGKLSSLKTELAAAGSKVEAVNLPKGAGFSFDTSVFNPAPEQGSEDAKPNSQPNLLYVGWHNDLGVVATADSLVGSVLGSAGSALPEVVNSPNFARATKDLPSPETVLQFGYWDLQSLFQEANIQQAKNPDSQVPLQGVAFAMSMLEAPQTDVRFIVDAKTETQRQFFSAIGSSQTGNLLQSISSNPLIFVSLDGQTVKRYKEIAAKQSSSVAPETLRLLSTLDPIQRIAFTARVAPAGQAMLPIPDLTIVAESNNVELSKSSVIELVGTAMSAAGLPANSWSEFEASGVKVKAMQSPMGMGINAFVATKGPLLLVSNSKAQISAAIDNLVKESKAFRDALPVPAQELLSEGKDVANLYVNFEEAGAFLETIRGVASMYASQSAEAQQFLSPENITTIKKMGALVGTVEMADQIISIRSSYHKSAKQVASLN